MPRKPKGPPARKKDGGIDRRGARTQKAETELPNGNAQQVEREQRRTKVSMLMGQGLTQTEIAERLRVGQSTISIDMTAIRTEWRAMRLGKFEETKDEVHGWALQNYRRAHALLEKAEARDDFALARLCLSEARKCAEQVANLMGMFPARLKDIDLDVAIARIAARFSVDPAQLPM